MTHWEFPSRILPTCPSILELLLKLNRHSCSFKNITVKCWDKILKRLTSLQTPPQNFLHFYIILLRPKQGLGPGYIRVLRLVFECLVKHKKKHISPVYIPQITRYATLIWLKGALSIFIEAVCWLPSSSRMPWSCPLLWFHWSVGSSPASWVPCQFPARLRAGTLLPAELNQSHPVQAATVTYTDS